MAFAWLITALASAGVLVGVFGHGPRYSAKVSAGGAGLLVAICVFWIAPEISTSLGWLITAALLSAVCGGLLLLDHLLEGAEHAASGRLLAPLLAAAALHSFLDGWSVRALVAKPFESLAVPLGLGLHKIPEGIALGWILRRSYYRAVTAAGIALSVELTTVLGAAVEPRAFQSGLIAFGASWEASVLSVIGGSFLFLGLHIMLPERRNPVIVAIFFCAFALVALVALR